MARVCLAVRFSLAVWCSMRCAALCIYVPIGRERERERKLRAREDDGRSKIRDYADSEEEREREREDEILNFVRGGVLTLAFAAKN